MAFNWLLVTASCSVLATESSALRLSSFAEMAIWIVMSWLDGRFYVSKEALKKLTYQYHKHPSIRLTN
ncbi:hypothetical protein C9J01_00835 [Photobacterium rosenbergii]|uniref:Uncharacterized protein n=1 Tax=Photobacterium rosenbergii TaxID=294936 RepID=A0A2T3NJ99_9GAMM|nr:hypothetical protein C9J01_00835 [Photobacterium rosenbergii]